jgi:hypothetical protein
VEATLLKARRFAIRPVLIEQHTELGVYAQGETAHGLLVYVEPAVLAQQKREGRHGRAAGWADMVVFPCFCVPPDQPPAIRLGIRKFCFPGTVKTREPHPDRLSTEDFLKVRAAASIAAAQSALKAYLIVAGAVKGVND